LIDGLKNGEFKRIVVLSGAGISVSAGIPDFRSPKSGLYSNLEKYKLPRPEDIFCIRYFNDHPEAFYQLAKEFLDTDKFSPTPTHDFIALLDSKDVL
jgi:NAD-dependent SIR2 family protein deacetylase